MSHQVFPLLFFFETPNISVAAIRRHRGIAGPLVDGDDLLPLDHVAIVLATYGDPGDPHDEKATGCRWLGQRVCLDVIKFHDVP